MRTRAVRWLLAALFMLALPAPSSAQDAPVVIYLVRHAERAEDGTNNPHISEAGRARAAALAALLADAGVTRMHTTDLHRTRETGAPLAEALGLELEVYDARDLPGLAARLRASPGRHVVLGHSNTTPALAAALGGESHGEIAEDEYDRLYVLFIDGTGRVTTVLLRFGEAWEGPGA